jgi:hypothetical protein
VTRHAVRLLARDETSRTRRSETLVRVDFTDNFSRDVRYERNDL